MLRYQVVAQLEVTGSWVSSEEWRSIDWRRQTEATVTLTTLHNISKPTNALFYYIVYLNIKLFLHVGA